MAYSTRMRSAVGAVRAALEAAGLGLQDARFARHGSHEPDADAPLVLVACSGGRDSMALAAVAATVCASLGLRCGGVVVDHGLQEGSAAVASQAARRCEGLGLNPVAVRRVAVRAEGEGVEAAAREARYDALAGEARALGAAAVLLAHTMDDQAETVLMGLLRSGGVDAVAGMPEAFERDGVRFLRPLLGMSREDTTGICRDLGLRWWDDPTNGDGADGPLPDGYPLRSRVRHDLMPFLERFAGGGVAAHLAQASRLARRDKALLDAMAERATAEAVAFADGECGDVVMTLRADVLEREPEAIRLRVVAHALGRAGIPCTSRHVEAIDRLIVRWHGQGAVSLPSGHSANRKKHVIRVCQDGLHANRRCSG